MKRYRIRIPPDLVDFLRHLHPEIKSRIRSALHALETDPYLGKPLKEQLRGLHSYRVSNYRIVYRIKQHAILIEAIDIAKRAIVYERVARLLRNF